MKYVQPLQPVVTPILVNNTRKEGLLVHNIRYFIEKLDTTLSQFYHLLLSEITTLSFESDISLNSVAQKMLKTSQYVLLDLILNLITLDQHQPSICGDRNTKSNGVHLEAQLQLRVRFQLGDSMSKQGEKRSMSKSKIFMKKYERIQGT